MELELVLDKKKRDEAETIRKNTVVKQLIPVGVDPKTVQCINYLNGNCEKGDMCQFGHEIKKEEKKEAPQIKDSQKVICRFMLDAMNSGEYSKSWSCPLPNCKDIHKLTELSKNSDVEITLEEYIEMQRQMLDETNLTPVNEKTFAEWKAKKQKEEELHAMKVAVLSTPKGAELFKNNPEMFVDEEEGDDDINYAERNYEESESENENE